MAFAFSLNRVRVTVDRQKLEQIANILGVPKVHRDRILKEGVVITVAQTSGGAAAATSRAKTGGAATAGRTSRTTTARTTRRGR